MKKMLLLLLAGAVVYLNYSNPPRENHEAFLLDALQARTPLSEEQADKVLGDIDFSNFMICSVTKTSLDSKLITIGYLNRVTLYPGQWLEDTVTALQKRPGG